MDYSIEEIYNEEPFYRVILTGDVGDGDYMDGESDFSQEEWDSIGVKYLKYMKENLFINREFDDRFSMLSEDNEEMYYLIEDNFNIPCAEWGYPHTIRWI